MLWEVPHLCSVSDALSMPVDTWLTISMAPASLWQLKH